MNTTAPHWTVDQKMSWEDQTTDNTKAACVSITNNLGGGTELHCPQPTGGNLAMGNTPQ